jgi:hypothetical protein
MKYASSHCTIICIMVSGTSTSSLLSRYAVVVSTRNRSSGYHSRVEVYIYIGSLTVFVACLQRNKHR